MEKYHIYKLDGYPRSPPLLFFSFFVAERGGGGWGGLVVVAAGRGAEMGRVGSELF